jgi:hypothetical protein
VNPQKSIVLMARNRDEKEIWMQRIQSSILFSRSFRAQLIAGIFLSLQFDCVLIFQFLFCISEAVRRNMASGAMSLLKHTSAFVGKSLSTFESKSESAFCSQCFREYSLFNRRVECKSCGELVCGNCMNHVAEIEHSGKAKVCDCCFGILSGMVKFE